MDQSPKLPPDILRMAGLMCQWGAVVMTVDDRNRCRDAAVGRIEIHGAQSGPKVFQFCAKHYDQVVEMTDPHAEAL